MSTNTRARWQVAIIGGGITGLSAALRVTELALAQDVPVAVTVFESSDRLGGKVQTLRTEDGWHELGADSFLARKEPVIRLCRKLGLDRDWLGTGPAARKTWLAGEGRLHPFPSGTYMGIPVWEEGILSSPFLSEDGRRRALEDLDLPDGSPAGDESIRDFLVRRFGEEMVDRIAEAVMSGIYGGRAEELSLLSTFPEFRQMERTYGSVLRALQARMAKAEAGATAQTLSRSVSSAPVERAAGEMPLPASVFLTLQSGLATLVEALHKRLLENAVDVRTATPVSTIREAADQLGHPRYDVTLSTGVTQSYDAVIVTTPSYAAAELLPDRDLAEQLLHIPYASVATVLLLYHAADLAAPFDGSGFVVPRREGTSVTAVTWMSSKWPLSTRPEVCAVRAFVGRSGSEEIVTASDDEIKRQVLCDLDKLMGHWLGQALPYQVVITRWHQAMPQYRVGHAERVAAIVSQVKRRYAGLVLAGAAYGAGVGIPDCIAQGEEAATQLFAK